ncbi:MAG: hypothetical protein QF755_05565 [Candidatus Peribacteraceae bacterium]|nr:hypothetical protein [Candidatus Peribacteraceae bacterium]HCI04307.1 hypothetical protein [Candidatus Peribacteria bacterium]
MLRSIIAAIFIQTCLAGGITVNPVPTDLNQLNQKLSEEVSHASVDLNGKGADLLINYSSPAPLSVYILFLNEDGSVNPRDIVSAQLPKGEVESVIPLSQTRGWSLGERKYKLHMITEKNIEPSISKLKLEGSPSLADGLKQFFALEPFTPSSYHRLSGYKFFGISFTLLLTLTLALALALTLIFRKKKHAMTAIIILILIFNARFSLDLLRYTKENLTAETYSTAGSAYQIADYFKSNGIKDVQLCSDGNTYFPTILKYAGYPLNIPDESEHVLVRNAYEWSFENGNLTCGELNAPATSLMEFPDGSILFKLSK